MILFTRSVQVRMGKGQEALQWAQEVAAHLNQTQPGRMPLRVFTEVFGPAGIGAIYWVGEYEDLASLEVLTAQRQADEQWMALMARGAAAGLFVDGSARDTVLRAV